jgi:DNA repair photolyase
VKDRLYGLAVWAYSISVTRGIIGRKAFKGRGALTNPAGRFEPRRIESVADGWFVEEQPDTIATTVEPDRARHVISTNDSPDIGFEYSINPYRGCEHGCVYCQRGDTPILLADGTTRPISEVRVGDEIYGTAREGWYRRYAKTRVLAHWSVVKPAYLIILKDGTELIAGADHRYLTERGWKFVTGIRHGKARRPHLTTGNRLMGTGAFLAPAQKNGEYRRGYLCGLIRGDGTLGEYLDIRPDRGPSHQYHFRLALCDLEALERARDWLACEQVGTEVFTFAAASAARTPMQAIRTHARPKVERVRELIAWPTSPSGSWRAGFLAGIFDAQGSYSDGCLRISNTEQEIIRCITDSLRASTFKFVVEHIHRSPLKPIDVVRVLGGLPEHLRFFHGFDPAITRKRDISGQAVKSEARLGVESVERLPGAIRLYDITTGTGDFIANGVVSHNCYARPSHAYMGLSAGIDFETRLFYKADAAKVLEEELARPGYVCKPIMLGANTDPYQPIERRMMVTRSVLEVLTRTRHPVSVISKSALVLRDLDLLTDLARDNLVSVSISITTLSADTKRALEPRTASPLARLRALRELSAAGIPTGVMVAPVIPAITDHEMEEILEQAAAAGAQWAGYVLLRLPYEIKDLFRDWLTEHFPDRAAHVMSLIRDMRGGRDNDPRFGARMRGTGPIADLLRNRFKVAARRLGLNASREFARNTSLFRPPGPAGAQMSLTF